eukprot:Skav215707  [mRNA]  locus=scaffold2573:242958:252224:+ [translate_table: standard]
MVFVGARGCSEAGVWSFLAGVVLVGAIEPDQVGGKALLGGGTGFENQFRGRRRFRGGGIASSDPSGRELVKAVCLSLVGDPARVDALWGQEWVETWKGWKELAEDGSDDMAMELARRFLRIAGMNIPTQRKSNRERLRELEIQKGLRLHVASSHGVNNCLIDTLLLGLVEHGLAPQGMTLAERERLCAECRGMLRDQAGVPLGVYLDGHRDAPRILGFFLGRLWKRDIAIRVCFYDSLDHAELELGPEELDYVDVMCGNEARAASTVLHVYNHTAATGQGYHFDALLPVSARGFAADIAEQKHAELVPAQAGRSLPESAQLLPARVESTTTRPGTVSMLAAPCAREVQELLQSFFKSRGVQITVHLEDASEVLACWGNRQALCTKLHTLQQGGLAYADSGWHASLRLVDQWIGYVNSCTQGPARKLGTGIQKVRDEQRQSHGRTNAQGTVAEDVLVSEGGSETVVKPNRRGKSLVEHRSAWVPLKRLRKKTPEAVALGKGAEGVEGQCSVEDVQAQDMFILHCDTVNKTKDPRRVAEQAVAALSQKLTKKPTLPLQYQNLACAREAYDLPSWHCSFQGCEFATETEKELEEHITSSHAEIFAEVSGKAMKEQDMQDMYAAAITWQCQSGPPVANVSIDRRALRLYQQSLEGNNISCLLCFVCARKYPHVKTSRNQHIAWVQPVDAKNETVFGQSLAAVEKILGLQAFKEKYVDKETRFAQQEMTAELEDWTSQVNLGTACVKLVCCPEDKVCRKKCKPETLCSQCWVPVCRTCKIDIVSHGRQPAAALSNDMMVYYAPRETFSIEVTVMEMLCSSPCLTTMICFSLEQKLRGDRAWDQDAWMNRQRMAMRGNATTFPLAWEDLLQQLRALEPTSNKERQKVQLPHSGAKLREIVNVIVKSHKGHETSDLGRILHQARVRRAVVVRLIEDAVARGHPAFQDIQMEQMYASAKALPEDGIPKEVIAELPYDSDLNAIMRQKAATPVRQEMAPEDLAQEMKSMAKPNAVVGERTSVGMADINAQHVSALQTTVAQSQGQESAEEATEFTLRTGNRLLDQFRPQYFGFAFPYVFKFCTGMPDPPGWSAVARYRRDEAAPRVELQEWIQIMARRCEAQIGRDWVYGFAAWNLYFRSALNLSRNLSLFSKPVLDEGARAWKKLAPKDIEAGAIQLLRALQGNYISQGGRPKPVKGDVSKLPYVRGLAPAARKLVQNMRHTAQSMPGTQEARKRMRFEIEALRIKFGTPIFVTFSPDEGHQMLYIRMARARFSDPVRQASAYQNWDVSDREYPPLDGNYTLPIHVESFCRALPTWEQRRQAMARDPLASVDGFRVLVLLVMEHLFGLRVCPQCPDCNLASSPYKPCQDQSGSSATLVGGVFGRMDAAYVTIEAQKSSGSLHAHCQCFVQCLHQHTPLQEVFDVAEKRLEELRSGYLAYSGHVMHGVYEGHAQEEVAAKIAEAEASWPEHKNEQAMIECPEYQRRRALPTDGPDATEAMAWAMEYLTGDVARLQFLKQHHYHPMNAETGERVPLHGCQKADKSGVCKSDFPREAWRSTQGMVLCPCQAETHGMATKGRKNRIGALHGPYGNEWLNCCHPAMLAALRGVNVDVQLPYRLPFKCDKCGHAVSKEQRREIVHAVQRAQDAQTGYCADYCAKNQPMAFHEIKEFQKGHQQLHSKYGQEPLEKLGKRHVTRFLSDAYCKGIVRGQVECCNLRAYNNPANVVAAERISTMPFYSFPGRAFLQAVNTAYDEMEEWRATKKHVWTRKGPGGQRQLRELDPVHVYGHRPQRKDIWCLSPYEFSMYWDCVPARLPHTRSEFKLRPSEEWDVTVTSKGEAKFIAAACDDTSVRLLPGVDYRRREGKCRDARVYFDGAAGRQLQHGWYLRPRLRPVCPHLAAAPVPSKWGDDPERNAKLTLVYFRSWTLNKDRANEAVPHLQRLRLEGGTWEASLRQWLCHLPCEETKRYVGNFLAVYRVRPENEVDNSDDEDDKDNLVVTAGELAQACDTQVPVVEGETKKGKWSLNRDMIVEAMERAKQCWKPVPCELQAVPNPCEGLDSNTLLKSLRRKTKQSNSWGESCVQEPEVHQHRIHVTRLTKEVDEWAQQSGNRCNTDQAEVCRKVASQVLQEMSSQSPGGVEPLRWAVHGGPGTGKSYVLNRIRKELFQDILGWKQGDEFQVVTLQAVMANDLNGDTIHHAFGLNWQGLGDERISGHKLLDLSAKALRWRWLIIDEISMVSAELLARLELRCRELVRDLAQSKYAMDQAYARPFGGLNVILAGDMWQLPPPRGTFLGDVPWEWLTRCKNKKVAHTIHGQQLVWGTSPNGIHGLTELVECERTRDTWLQTLQNEVRNGALSETNHQFLHGFATRVPGSWNGHKLECGAAACQKLLIERASREKIQRLECSMCKTERRSKARVADEATRTTEKFAKAKAIFATNAVKYHVNKLRAKAWAAKTGQVLHHAIAKDRISSMALREKPDLGKEKLTWLQRHDQECGSLYGVLPLCLGMPVAAADHLDRNRGILRGCPGEVVGWAWAPDAIEGASQETTQIWNELPACILVRFKTKNIWRVEGIDEDNVFPVAPQKKPWHLDKGRKRPVLRITRKQFPLAPGFAITAHAAQGQTYAEGAVVDMQIGDAGDPLTAYIALTRVQDRHGLFVYRPFAAGPFQKGAKVGRELLLRFWAGEKLDWAALRAKYREEKHCKECNESKPAAAFTAGRWKRTDAALVCKECLQRHVEAGQPWQCMSCARWKDELAFQKTHAGPQATFYRVCNTCARTQMCSACKSRKDKTSFSRCAWKRTRGGVRLCVDCSGKVRSLWTCVVCKGKKERAAFQIWVSQQASLNGDQVCDKCRGDQIARGFAAKTVRRITATQAKVAKEKQARVIAQVWEEIADRKRKREGKASKTEGPTPKREREENSAEAEVLAKGRADTSTIPENSAATTPPQLRAAKQRNRKLFEYHCPACGGAVASSVRTGQVDHRRACGNRFSVKNGKVVAKMYVYSCPFCKGSVSSNTRSGQIDHRTVCNNQFYVKDGQVSKRTRQHAHACPVCHAVVWSSQSSGLIDISHKTPAGKACKKRTWHVVQTSANAESRKR